MGLLDNRFNLAGKSAFVTGGAQGLGKCICETFAQCGVNIAVVDKKEAEAKALAEDLGRAYSVKTLGIGIDVQDPVQVDMMASMVLDSFGSIEIAVNNAGITAHSDILSLTPELLRSICNVNITGAMLTAQAAARIMLASKIKGSIINTVSISARIINKPQKNAVYSISKAGLLHMTKSMAVELAPSGIRVNSVSPGFMATGMIKDSPYLEEWMELTPMRKIAETESIVGAYLYLAGDMSMFTTGCDIVVDGGYTCW